MSHNFNNTFCFVMAAQQFGVRAWLKAIDCSEYEPNLSLCHSMTRVIKGRETKRKELVRNQ